MRSFLLFPRMCLAALPPGPFSGDLELARRRLVQWLGHEIPNLEAVNYTELHEQLAELNRKFSEDDWEECSALADSLSDQMSEYADKAIEANDSWFNLKALEAVASAESDQDFLSRIEDQSWPVRMEIGARRYWFDDQLQRLREGVNFSSAFRGRVSERNTSGRKFDREYYQLIQYLHGLQLHTGERFIPVKRSETPDFVLESDDGSRQLGAEVGEAPVSQQWADDQDQAAIVQEAISRILASTGRSIFIDEPCSWTLWAENLPDLEAVVQAGTAKPPAGGDVRIEERQLGFRAALNKGNGTIFIHDPSGHGSSDIARASQEMADGVRMAVEKKLVKKNGMPRKEPAVRPCDLVLYPNSDNWPDREEARRLAAAQLPKRWSDYFDRIWLSSEFYFGQLA